MHRAFRYRLYPTPDQEQKFQQFAGVCRFIYNLALEQREKMWTYYRDNGTPLNFFRQNLELTQLRAEVDWIEAVPQCCEEAALRDLDRAFANFYAGRGKYPTYHRRGANDAFRFRGRDVPVRSLNAKWADVRLPKVGWVRMRVSRAMRGTQRTVTVSRDELGWYVSFACEIEATAATLSLPAVGIDRGVANTLALSTGEMFSVPPIAALDRRVRHAQRAVARRVKGSHRRDRAKRKVSCLVAKVARVRKHWQHVTALRIAERFGCVVIEELRVKSMTASGRGKRGLNRSILAQGWTGFAAVLDYKLAERGGTLILVDPAYTSQTCSSCGTIDKLSRESQSRFVCRHCGFEAHADHNAAVNILRRGSTPLLDVEGLHQRPREASTVDRAA